MASAKRDGASLADFGGFNCWAFVLLDMECHYCDDGADVVVEKDGIRVGVCEDHFRDQMETLADSDWMDEIQDELDVDRAE